MMLQLLFRTIVTNYNNDVSITERLWNEIEGAYSGKKRYYHNLQHLENMLRELSSCKSSIADYDTMIFALVYHDIVYKATAKDNEEKSADIAAKRLLEINYPIDKIELCRAHILATKSHHITSYNDINLFTDADLAILGYDWPYYTEYFKQVRKEYAIYPDFLYNPGRKKVLEHFLAMDSIFKTVIFKNKYEAVARLNIEKELALLF